jgi:hypothetical protein
MPPDQSIPVAEPAHRLEDIEVLIFQIWKMREDIVPDQILQVKVVGTLPRRMVAIRDRIEEFSLPLYQAVVFLIHLLAYSPKVRMLVSM